MVTNLAACQPSAVGLSLLFMTPPLFLSNNNMRKLFVVICRKPSRLNCRCCTYRSLISKHFKVNKVTWCPNFVTNMIITTLISIRIICIYVTWIVFDIQRVCHSPCTSHADREIIRNISQHVLKMSRS